MGAIIALDVALEVVGFVVFDAVVVVVGVVLAVVVGLKASAMMSVIGDPCRSSPKMPVLLAEAAVAGFLAASAAFLAATMAGVADSN